MTKTTRPYSKLLLVSLMALVFTWSALAQKKVKNDPLRQFHRRVIKLSQEGKLDSALMLSQELVQRRKENKDTFHLIRAYVDQMEILRSLNDIESAIEKGNEVEDFVDNARLSVIVGDFYNRRSAIHYESEEKVLALEYLHRAQDVYQTFNDTLYELSNLNIEGAIYRELDSFDRAVQVLSKLLKKSRKHSNSGYVCLAAYNLAMTYFKANEFDSAIYYTNAFLNEDHSIQEASIVEDVHQIRVSCYQAKGDFEKAFNYLIELQELRLASLAKLNKEKIEEARIILDLKNREIENAKKGERNNYLFITLSSGLLLMLITILSLRNRQKNLKKLHEQDRLLNDELKESLDFKNKLIGIVAHDIKNPLSGLSGIIALCKEGDIDQAEFKNLLDLLDSNVNNVTLLLENLVNWVKSQGEGFKTELAEFESEKMVNAVLEQIDTALKAKNIAVNLNDKVQTSLIYSDFDMLSYVTRNVISNAVKFSHKGGEIDIELKETPKELSLLIKDYGVGMDQASIDKIYQNKAESTIGTQNERGTGLGLALCQEMLRMINGKLLVTSELGQGTEVQIILNKES